jgi:hypothetical protein
MQPSSMTQTQLIPSLLFHHPPPPLHLIMIAISASPALLLLQALLALLALSAQETIDVDIDLANLSPVWGAGERERLGYSVSGAGDVNGDGFDDVIIGAPVSTSTLVAWGLGTAYVILGTASGFTTVLDMASFTSGNSTGYIIQGGLAGDALGSCVSGAGDVNGDGFADVLVGAMYADPNGRDKAGVVYVIFGMAGGFGTLDMVNYTSGNSTGYVIQGAKFGAELGHALSAAGDVNNDTYADVILGSELSPTGKYKGGSAYVILGRATGFATLDLLDFISGDSTGFIIAGAEGNDLLGGSVSGAGDMNGDGFDDVIVGARSAGPNSRSRAGAAYVIFGMGTGFTTLDMAIFTSGDSAGFIVEVAVANDIVGWSVGGAGDVNNDGFDDVLVSASRADPNSRADAGAAYVIFGMATGFATLDMLNFTSSNSTGYIIQVCIKPIIYMLTMCIKPNPSI